MSRRAVVLGTVAVTVAAYVQLAPGGSAALPTATAISSVIVTGSVTPPAGSPNKPSAIVVQGQAFSVAVSFADAAGNPLPLSYNRTSTVTLSVAPSAVLSGESKLTVPAGATSATASGLTLSPAQNRLSILATVTGGPKTALAVAPQSSELFDLLTKVNTADSTAQFLNSEGTSTPCVPTRSTPQCADLYLPHGSGDGGSLLSVGHCDTFLGCDAANDSVIQMLAGLSGYSTTDPATLVLKCDKSSCSGGGINSYVPKVSLAASGPLSPAPACGSKGVVTTGDFCVDYVQSKRDGAGDLLLFVLFAIDSRGSCC